MGLFRRRIARVLDAAKPGRAGAGQRDGGTDAGTAGLSGRAAGGGGGVLSGIDTYLALLAQASPDLEDQLVRDDCRESLHAFVREFWDVLEPGRPFVDNWHLRWLCAELEAITEGDTTRLLINVPPGAMKSMLLVFWTAWEWGPRGMMSLRYLCASYTQTLTIRDNRRRKMLLTDPRYQRLWPDVKIDPNRTSDENFGNTKTGWCIATSTGGVGTGERADRVLTDDPHSVNTADSDAIRAQTLHWWREVVPTRVNDPQLSAFVVVMQRVHEGDVSGDILDNRGPEWTHVMIPMRYEPDRHCVTDHGEDPRTEPGELYWPERFPEWTVVRDSIPLGRYGVASQFQQLPAPRGGGIVLRESWRIWPPPDEADRWTMQGGVDAQGQPVPMVLFPPFEFVTAYVDTAFTAKEENAYCAFVRFAVFADSARRPKVMMAQAWRDRPTLRNLCIRLLDSCRRGKVDVLVIENKAGAEWVKQEMSRLMRSGEFSIVLDEPRGDKVARLHAVAPLFEDGVVFAPDRAWADLVISEVSTFPKGRFADLTDCVSGGLGYLRRGNLIKLSVEHDEDEREAHTFRGNSEGIAAHYGVG
jgi:predicted phage terminase large subunit-like protein